MMEKQQLITADKARQIALEKEEEVWDTLISNINLASKNGMFRYFHLNELSPERIAQLLSAKYKVSQHQDVFSKDVNYKIEW